MASPATATTESASSGDRRCTSSSSSIARGQGAQAAPSASRLRIVLVGDVMLGRLVDQLLPSHVDEPEEHREAQQLLHVYDTNGALARELQRDPTAYVWGDLLSPYFDRSFADLRVVNLETSATTSSHRWPNKSFNYRMHPDNVAVLTRANIDYASLANNHILDFKEEGMRNTLDALTRAGIAHSGCGMNSEEVMRPAIMHVNGIKVGWFSLSDHYSYWAASSTQPGINFVRTSPDLTEATIERVCGAIQDWRAREGFDFIGVSVHWGPNYSWSPSTNIRTLAHALIDRVGVDIIHGTSSHHIQAVEEYHSGLILYGCGDFIDDYAVDDEYRNDLSFIYVAEFAREKDQQVASSSSSQVAVAKLASTPSSATMTSESPFRFSSLEFVPSSCRVCRAHEPSASERRWLHEHLAHLSAPFGSSIEAAERGRLGLVVKKG